MQLREPPLPAVNSCSNLGCSSSVSLVMSRGWLKAIFVPSVGSQVLIWFLLPGTRKIERISGNRRRRDCWNSQEQKNRLGAVSHTTSSTYVLAEPSSALNSSTRIEHDRANKLRWWMNAGKYLQHQEEQVGVQKTQQPANKVKMNSGKGQRAKALEISLWRFWLGTHPKKPRRPQSPHSEQSLAVVWKWNQTGKGEILGWAFEVFALIHFTGTCAAWSLCDSLEVYS